MSTKARADSDGVQNEPVGKKSTVSPNRFNGKVIYEGTFHSWRLQRCPKGLSAVRNEPGSGNE